jgi:ABC-type nitrate/sulfonate/bicarbonate transport system substrate-binding protein
VVKIFASRRPDRKKVGIVAFGGAHELSMALALKEWNIPRQSVTLLAGGPSSNRLIALSKGAFDATLLAPPDTGEASRMGMHILSNLSDLKTAAFPINVVATRRSFLGKNREVVKRFLQAYSEGLHQFITNKEKALAITNQRLKQKILRLRTRLISSMDRSSPSSTRIHTKACASSWK